jgi:hypothetical protein
MMSWVWLYIPAAIFLAFSAALWLVVKDADTEPALAVRAGWPRSVPLWPGTPRALRPAS